MYGFPVMSYFGMSCYTIWISFMKTEVLWDNFFEKIVFKECLPGRHFYLSEYISLNINRRARIAC